MKNTIKILMIMGALFQGSASIADDSPYRVTFASKTEKISSYTFKPWGAFKPDACPFAESDSYYVCEVGYTNDFFEFGVKVTKDGITCGFTGQVKQPAKHAVMIQDGNCEFGLGIAQENEKNITVNLK